MSFYNLSLLLIVAVLMGGYNFFIKTSAGSIHEVVGAVILQTVAACLGTAVLAYLKFQKISDIHATGQGIGFAVAAGVCVGLAEIVSFYAFGKEIPVSVGLPIVLGGTILAGVALGMLFLGETFTLKQWLGIVCIIAGIMLIKS